MSDEDIYISMSYYRQLLERIAELERELAEAREQTAAYQIAKDNLELRLESAEIALEQEFGPSLGRIPLEPRQVY